MIDRNKVLFTVMLLSIPSRLEKCLIPLYNKLLKQCEGVNDVELLCLVDNKAQTIGEKRQHILQSARGRFVAFLDDDDQISDDYISSLREVMLANTENGPDVITFDQHCTVNGEEFNVNFRHGNPHEGLKRDPITGRLTDIKRPPYHMCAWSARLARGTPFKIASYGEDIDWCARMYARITKEIHIDKVLHYYQYSDAKSESVKYASTPNNR